MSFIEKLWNDHKEELIDRVFDDKMQDKVVKALNDNIDIPFISEKTEAKYLNAMYDTVEEVVKKYLENSNQI